MNYHYLKKIILNKEAFKETIAKRKEKISYDELENLYNQYRKYLDDRQLIEGKINALTKEIQKNFSNELKNEVKSLKNQKEALVKPDLSKIDYIPNFLNNSVPIGDNSDGNSIIKTVNSDKSIENAIPHYKFSEILTNRGVNMSGSRFTVFSGKIAKLFRALSQFFLDKLTNYHEFEEMIVPYLVLDKAMYNSGNLPKFDEESFKTDKYRLIPTAEVSLINLFENRTFDNLDKIRVCAFTPCFRSEVGSAGLDTQGIKRLHQFHKVEMVSITREDNSEAEHELLLKIEEEILQDLKLPYRIVNLCSGDIGFHSSKTYDIEVYMPSIKQYMEISSCSNCIDFQAIRSNIKYKVDNHKKFAHTLNGSAFPIERMIAAIIENYQYGSNNDFRIPEILKKYIN